jgi:MFS family permease
MTGAATRYRWVVLAVAVAAFAQTHLHRMAFAPLIPTFVGDLGLSYTAAGTMQTAYFWTYALAQIPIGVLADRWGSRRVMLACLTLLTLGALAFAGSRTFAESVAARMLVGLGAAAAWVPGMRLVTEWFPAAERGRATGMLSAGGGVGGTVGLIVVPWLASVWGWRVAYGTLALPALATAVLIALLLRHRGDGGAGAVPAPGSLGRVLATRATWALNLTVLFSYGGYFSFLTFLPAFLVARLDVSPTEAGMITSLLTAATIVSWPLAGALSDRLGRRKPIFLASQAAGARASAAFALVVPALGPTGAAVLALATGLGVGGTILPFVTIVELFSREVAATAASVTNAATFVGGIVLPVALGRVVDVTGTFWAAFLVAAAVQGVACAFGAFIPETGPRGYTRG